jgi:GH24 family phage-related lysozyme (muramidase)
MVNPHKGTAGNYSFYPLFANSHVLDGAPDNNHVPGTGSHPGNVLLSQIFKGTSLYVHPLSGTFKNGAAYEGARFRPHTYKGVLGVFTSGYGHVDRSANYSLYSNYVFDGVTSANAFNAGYGHSKRTVYYSFYNNDLFDGVPSATIFKSGYGQLNVESSYGRNKVGEYKGVPSAKAL